MAIRKVKPITPGQRRRSVSAFDTITASEPEKSLLAPVTRKGGRNNNGRITTRHQGNNQTISLLQGKRQHFTTGIGDEQD